MELYDIYTLKYRQGVSKIFMFHPINLRSQIFGRGSPPVRIIPGAMTRCAASGSVGELSSMRVFSEDYGFQDSKGKR